VISTALVSQRELIPGLSHPIKTETKNATCPPSCGCSAAALAFRGNCIMSTHCHERGELRSHRVLGRHGRPAQVRRHHLSTETKNVTYPNSCGRSSAAIACGAACTVSTHCRERGESRSYRVLGRHNRPAQVRRHHLSTETKNATCPHSCGRSVSARAHDAAFNVSTHGRECRESRSHRVLGRHGRPAQVRRHHLSTETKNATCPHSCAARPRRLHVEQLAPCRHIAVSVANRAATVYWAFTAVPSKSVDTTCLQKPTTRLARILAAARPRRLHAVHFAHCQKVAGSVANRAATVYWAVTAVPRKSVDTTCLQKPKTRLAPILAAARPLNFHLVELAPCRHIALSVANRAATVYWAVTAVPRKSVDTTCLQKQKTRLAPILAAARPRRMHLVELAPCRQIALIVANRAATMYWAVTAVPRKSADTTCLQKPNTRLARILAASRSRRLQVVELASCRRTAMSVANRAVTVYWAVTAVPRKSVDTTCLRKPKTRLARILAAARSRRVQMMHLSPCRPMAASVANRAATAVGAVPTVLLKSVDTTCLQKSNTRLARILAAALSRRLPVVQLAPCRHIAVSVANCAATVYWAVTC